MNNAIKNILVVDDDSISRFIHRKIFEKAGYAVEDVKDGQEAIDKVVAQPNHYDLILIDYNMPNKNGVEATKEIRGLKNSKKRLSIVGITSNPEMKNRCLGSEMDDVISKPVSEFTFKEIINRYLM
jgi:two-component system sensor histidine kinase RpfC